MAYNKAKEEKKWRLWKEARAFGDIVTERGNEKQYNKEKESVTCRNGRNRLASREIEIRKKQAPPAVLGSAE